MPSTSLPCFIFTRVISYHYGSRMGRVGGACSCDNQILGGFQPGRSAPWKVSEKWAGVSGPLLGDRRHWVTWTCCLIVNDEEPLQGPLSKVRAVPQQDSRWPKQFTAIQ